MMVNKSGNKKNDILLAIVIILFGLLLVGGTYAALSITLPINITNGIYNYATECFNINYSTGGDFVGTLIPSSTYVGGLDGGVSLGIDPNCNVNATGDIVLNVKSASDVLIQNVDPHCENSTNLETMNSYTTSDSCTSNGGVWVTNGTALKYAVFHEFSTSLLNVGYINKTGNINVYSNFPVSSTLTKYYIYIWLDGELVDDSYISQSFDAVVDVNVVQKETD